MAEVINKLERMTYYQESYAIKDYLDKFCILISEACYTDLYTIVVKFHYSLQTSIQNQIATLPVSKPEGVDPSAWYNTACRIN